MYKKIVKGVILGVSVVFFTLMVGYITYLATLNMINRSSSDYNSAEAVSSNVTPSDSDLVPSSSPAPETYYLARLNGENIEIYLCSNSETLNNNQKFLYSFKVYPSDIPDEDVLALTRGIIFRTKEELASFEEDYNS